MELTSLEKKFIKAIKTNDYGDGTLEPIWVSAVIDASGIDPKIARGVISSLIKKRLVLIYQYEPGENGATIQLTEKGKFVQIPFSNEEYIQNGGGYCPFCKSENIQRHSFEIKGKRAEEPITCNNCGKGWKNIYTITSYIV